MEIYGSVIQLLVLFVFEGVFIFLFFAVIKSTKDA